MNNPTEGEFAKDVDNKFHEWLIDYISGEIQSTTWRCESTRTVHITQVKGYISKALNDKYQNVFGRGISLSDKVKDIVHTGLTEMGYIMRDRFGLYDLSPDSDMNRLDHRIF